jgi:DNA-binding NarL/FixJ family response regulator
LSFIIKQTPEFELIFDASNGIELIERLCEVDSKPNVILLDIKMPEMDGMECTSKIKSLYPDTKIIILTMYDQEDFILHLLDLGVNSYLLKSSSAQEVNKAIRTVVEKDYYFDDAVCRVMLRGLKRKKIFKPRIDDHVQITAREKEVLDLILMEYTTSEIADQLFVSVRTAETHRKNLLEKFGVKNTAGLVIKSIKLGLYNP